MTIPLVGEKALTTFLETCCYGNGIVVLTIEEQQMIFKRLSSEVMLCLEENRNIFLKISFDILG